MNSPAKQPIVAQGTEGMALAERYHRVREFTRTLCVPLHVEDMLVQSMPQASPIRWHLAHTTWFFETFLLRPSVPGYQSANESFEYLFNSYYNSVGKPYPRHRRGLLTRPTVAEVWAYRQRVDDAMTEWLAADRLTAAQRARVELGIQHEQQHQELMLTDIKHALSGNPLWPSYRDGTCGIDARGESGLQFADPPRRDAENIQGQAAAADWLEFKGRIAQAGRDESAGFSFDNEHPRHDVLLGDYALCDRLVTNGEYLDFVESDGYQQPAHWLSLGWDHVQRDNWAAPLYWVQQDGRWAEFTLDGLQPIDWEAPVCHVSFFEADAYARWAGGRLPTEFEWEAAVEGRQVQGNFADSMRFHPRSLNIDGDTQPGESSAGGLQQSFGDVWEWTASQYLPYPGYRPPAGALGEYNGKFMCNQFVLRGGSCASSQSHLRASYRNFFAPESRWQFTGLRLAR